MTLLRRLACGLIAIAVITSLASPAQAQAVIPQPPATFTAECPPTIRCIVEPAAYIANGGDIEDYGNYDIADRPGQMAINSIVIHNGEGTLKAILDHFKDPKAYVSSHYVIDHDGTVYQMVQTKNIPWHAGNWWYNMHSIGIEHVGYAATGNADYTPAMMRASAELVKYLTGKFGIPRDRAHILGHDNVPAPTTARVPAMHTDPGPYWNWSKYMQMIGGATPTENLNGYWLTVAPNWDHNKQIVTGCSFDNKACAPSGPQSANFIYARTAPRHDAPLFSDPVLGQGTTAIGNNAARVFDGQTLAITDRRFESQGVWYQVLLNGKNAWVYSPKNAPTVIPNRGTKFIKPKAGKSTVPVYGRPSPEKGAYPDDGFLTTEPSQGAIKRHAPWEPLQYVISAGQRYAVTDAAVPNDHFYAWSSTADRERFPYDHTVFTGQEQYVQIQFGNRLAFVKRSHVTFY